MEISNSELMALVASIQYGDPNLKVGDKVKGVSLLPHKEGLVTVVKVNPKTYKLECGTLLYREVLNGSFWVRKLSPTAGYDEFYTI